MFRLAKTERELRIKFTMTQSSCTGVTCISKKIVPLLKN